MSEVGVEDAVNIRKYTKTVDPEGRKAVAASVSQKRAKNFTQLSTNLDQQSGISQNIPVLEQQGKETLQAATGKASEIYGREHSVIGRLLKKFRIGDPVAKKLNEEAQGMYKATDATQGAKEDTLQQKQGLEKGEETLREERKGLRTGVDEYYEKWRYDTLTPEQKKELFKPENLKNLTTEEYLELWRRGSPYFVSHVTRQGFRDHNAMFDHGGGMNEFANGFVGVLQDERTLGSLFNVLGLKGLDEKSITEFLSKTYLADKDIYPNGPFGKPDAESAKAVFLEVFNRTWALAPNYPDKTAVHLAAQKVLDGYYGAERGNEIFFVFPSDYIASQYAFAFNSWQKDFTKPQSEDKWNDLFVWTGKDAGILLDAGFVFVPENAKVDPMTGSRYASWEVEIDGVKKRVMMKDNNVPVQFRDWLNNNVGKLSEYENILTVASRGLDSQSTQRDVMEKISDDLVKQGWDDHEAWLGASRILQWNYNQPAVAEWSDEKLFEILEETGKLYKKPETTVSSKEFWEKYFADHPDQKPKHVIYYSGDPSTAVYNRLQKEGIAERGKQNDPLLGFRENHVGDYDQMRTDPRSNQGYEEIIRVGNQIIDQYYSLPKAA